MYNIYVSGALTGVDNPLEIKDFYESIGVLCQTIGLRCYVPHVNTDPIDNPDITPQQVFETDKFEVSQADLVIAYVGIPSLGVGMELAYAEIQETPIVILYEKGKKISRFPRGIPTIIAELQFTGYEDALEQLKSILIEWSLAGKIDT
jgi:2'-deoxynucleoside 5'-phosphate N-hydrolase